MRIALKRSLWFAITLILILSGCEMSKSEVMDNLVSKERDKLVMVVFGDSGGPEGFQFQVNGVYNSSDFLRQNVPPENYKTYVGKEELNWLDTLGIEQAAPIVLILDNEKIIFQTKEPEALKGFAKEMEGKTLN